MNKSEYVRFLEQMRYDLIKSGDVTSGSEVDTTIIDFIEEVYNMGINAFEEFYKETLKE